MQVLVAELKKKKKEEQRERLGLTGANSEAEASPIISSAQEKEKKMTENQLRIKFLS